MQTDHHQSQQQMMSQDSSSSAINTVSPAEYYKQVQQKYEKFEQLIKNERENEFPKILSELARELEAITLKKLDDAQHIQLLCGTFIPKLVKMMLSKKYYYTDVDLQIMVTQFLNLWIKLRVPLMGDFFRNNNQQSNESQDTRDPIHKIVGIQKEFEILEMIFDDNMEIYNHRTSKNTPDIETEKENQDDQINTFEDFKLEVAHVKKAQLTSYYYVHNINVFSKFNGFDQLLKLLSFTNSEALDTRNRPTFKMLMGVLNMLLSMRPFFRENFWLDYAVQIKDICIDFIYNKCTPEDLRNTNKKELTYFSNHIESILDSLTFISPEEKTEKVYQVSESLELELALRCLNLPILEKKLIGHTIIVQKIYQVRNNNSTAGNQQQTSEMQQNRNIKLNIQGLNKRWLNTERLIEWMDKQRIFDLVFGDSLHSEVIKKSYTLLQFLYQNNRIQQRELDKMWDCATKKHEAYKVAILKALAFLASKASHEHLQYLFYKLKTLHLTEIDKFCLGLIRSIAKKLSGDLDTKGDDFINDPQLGISGNRNNNTKMNKSNPFLFDLESNKKLANKKQNMLAGGGDLVWAQDDMCRPMILQDNQTIQKKTRSYSLGEENDIKKGGASSLLGKVTEAQTQVHESQKEPQQQQNNQDRINNQRQEETKNNQTEEENPLDVPIDKEDKNTADEEGSFGEKDDFNIRDSSNNVLFENPQRDFMSQINNQPIIESRSGNAIQSKQKKQWHQDYEEEKDDGAIRSGNQGAMVLNLHEMIQDQSLGIDNQEKRDLAHQLLEWMWSLCIEETVTDQHLSVQSHKLAIEQFTQTLIYNYPKAILPYVAKCINCLHQNYSVISIMTILQKLLMNVSYPLDKNRVLPKNRQELIQLLDEELNITNECLSSYIEFKRVSLSLIFDQLGSQEQEQENLETQSSLDNDDERSSSMQSAQKNTGGGTQTNNLNIQEFSNAQLQNINLHDDLNTIQSSSSLFVSPRGKMEEELKMPFPQKTQSYQGDGIQGISRVAVDFSMNVRENNEIAEDRSQKHSNPQLQLIGSSSMGNRQFNSTTKRQSAFQSQFKSDVSIQQNLNNNQQFSVDTPKELLNEAPIQSQQTQPQNNNRDFLNQLLSNEVYKFSYYEELQFRLDFLKFLIGSCPAILTPQQLQVLWECLVVNAFYEKERDQFFNWCSQILKAAQNLPGSRDSDQIGGQNIFNDDCLEMLFFDTLLKLDFRYITETMYECFERYLIYINEQYGQIVTNSAFESAFEVFETKLIGIEALWEITLCARNDKVYKKAAEFLHKLYKKMSPTLVEKLNEIKEDLLQTCMEQIKTGLTDIRNEFGNDFYDLPIYQFSQSIEDPKNRIARSISQLCKFIDEFEGLREKGAKSQFGAADKEILIIGNNQISNAQPKKIQLNRPLSTKVGQLREEFANALNPKRQPKEISMMHKGRDLNEDLKTLKDLGIDAANDQQIQIFVSLRNQFEMDEQERVEDQANNELIEGMIEQVKMFLGEIDLPKPVLKLAIQKCNMNLEETIIMIIDEEKVNDLQEEVRRNEENNNIVMIEEVKEENNGVQEEAKINLILSNRSEYFELLFELLNLGINEITNAAWNLLVQIPVNKQLLHQIRTLSSIQQGSIQNWSQIIDPTNAYKMLYSIQIVNSLISVNNEKLSEAEIQERYEWRLRFLELGGFDHLYSILITADADEFLGNNTSQLLQQKLAGSAGKRKLKGQPQKKAITGQTNQKDQKEQQQMNNNSVKCLGYLISIIKIFIQAALLTTDEERLLTLIVQSSTSPFRKPKSMNSALQSVPQNKINQLMFGGGTAGLGLNPGGESSRDDTSRDNSSIYTPKFQSSKSSTPQCQTPNAEPQNADKNQQQMNKSVDTFKAETIYSHQTFNKANENQLYTQVDDFPRLVEQISGPIAQNLLEKVVNFNGLISKLLNIIYKAVMFCDSLEVSQLVQNSLDLLLPCVVWKPQQLLKEIYEFENLESLLIRTLMFNQNENVRRSLERTFKIICGDSPEFKQAFENAQNAIESPKVYILKILLKNLPDIKDKSDQCEEFFNLITHLMKQCQSNFKVLNDKFDSAMQTKSKIILEDSSFNAIALLEWCIYQLKQRPTYEDKYSTYTDKILAGYLQLTQSVLEINQDLKRLTCKGGYNLVKTVFDFLFLLPSMEDQQSKHQRSGNRLVSTDSHPKCKKKLTRKKAFNLLLTLCHQCEENFNELLQELYKFHAQIQKSQRVVSFSEFDNEVGMRSATGYVGLKNFGCTCYMNALIQQLFMIPDLKKGILEADVNDPDYESNVLYQLKLTFANLQESEKQYYAPQGFTKAFKFYGEPVNVRVQQDSYEFYSLLFDNLEQLLNNTPHANLIKDTVGGTIGNETKSLEKDYPYTSERDEPFFAISLDIKNKKNLAEALDLYIKPDFLEGDNKYHCEKYNQKVVAQRRSYLKKLSNTVIINLKRFEFDYNSMQRFKVNDYCEFPLRINLKPWTKEGIIERERQMTKNEKNNNEGAKSQDEQQDQNQNEEVNILDEALNVEVEDNEGVEIDSEEDNQDPSNEESEEEEVKKGGEAIDEGMESNEDENDQNVNTGTYFDDGMEDIIDIAVDDEEIQNESTKKTVNKTKQLSKSQSKNHRKRAIQTDQQRKKKSLKKLEKDDRYYEYELVGILVHSGSADAGHYYSFIKERGAQNGRWLDFNDTYVKEFDIKNLEQECFGGNHDNRNVQSNLLDDFANADARLFERCRNAYLLIYERVNPIKPQIENIVQQHIQQAEKKLINGIESNVYKRIWEENAAFMKLKIFFDQEYFSFAREYVNLYNFENVLYFNQEHSSCYKSKNLIHLSDQYLKEQNEEKLSIDYKQRQQEIEQESKKSGDSDIFAEQDKIMNDPGLYTIKLATILSQDIITKVKDVQSFVQWMQLINSLYERHAVACVWLIKYLTDNRNLLEELLLESQYFEVRESFAKLLMTAISVTAKNEEFYLFDYEEVFDFDVDKLMIQNRQLSTIKVSKSAVIRFMDVFFNQMLDTVRVHWRRFEEYFHVLVAFVQIGFAETKYLIMQKAIVKLLEFVMNCSAPFYSTIKMRMGDRMQEPNFTQAIDILSILTRSCITQGIQQVSQYSPLSIFQSEDKHIQLPRDEIKPFLTSDCFTTDLLTRAPTNNDSLLNIVLHLCWGDLESSKFFIDEIIQSIKNRRIINDIPNHFKILSGILRQDDELQEQRLNLAFNFEGFPMNVHFFKFLENLKGIYQIYVLRMLLFFGDLAILDAKIMKFMQQNKFYYCDFVQEFLLSMSNSSYAKDESKQNQANVGQLISSCVSCYARIFDSEELNQVPYSRQSQGGLDLHDFEMMKDTEADQNHQSNGNLIQYVFNEENRIYKESMQQQQYSNNTREGGNNYYSSLMDDEDELMITAENRNDNYQVPDIKRGTIGTRDYENLSNQAECDNMENSFDDITLVIQNLNEGDGKGHHDDSKKDFKDEQLYQFNQSDDEIWEVNQ